MSHNVVRIPCVLLFGFVAACSGSWDDSAPSSHDAISISSLGHPDGTTIMGAPAVVRWTDDSTYVFVTAETPGGSGPPAASAIGRASSPPVSGSKGGPVCVKWPCNDPPPTQSLWYRQLKQGVWSAWTSLGGLVDGEPSAAVTDPYVTSQNIHGTPTAITPGHLHVVARGKDGYLTRCFLETAPQDTVLITITGSTTFSYSLNGQAATGNLTIPVGGTFSIPNAHTDLVVSFPPPLVWQETYYPGDTYTITPHQLVPRHTYARLTDTPDLTVNVTTSVWSACQSVPIVVTSKLGITPNLLSPVSAALSQRGNDGKLKIDLLYGFDESATCSPTSHPTDSGCQSAFYDMGYPLTSYPASTRVIRTSNDSWAQFYSVAADGTLNHQARNIFASGIYTESIGVHVLDPPSIVISAGAPQSSDAPSLDLFTRDPSGQLLRIRNYSLDALTKNGADAGVGGQSDGGVGRSGFWTSDALGGHLDSAPAALLAASSSVGTTAALHIWNVYGLQGQDLVELKVQEIVNLGNNLIAMPDSSCTVPYELQAKLTFCKSATTKDMIPFCQDTLDDIARQFPAGSSCQSTMRAFHFEIWLGLLNRALPFGATQAPDPSTIGTSLGYLDQFYRLERSLFPEAASTSSSLSADHARRLAEVFSQHAYAAAEASLESTLGTLPNDPTAIGNAMEAMSRATIVVDQQILQVAFADGNGTGPITSPALLWVMADRLDALFQRMRSAGGVHDLGCRFRDDCNQANTELAELWNAIGALADATTLSAVLCKPGSTPVTCIDNATAMRGDWKSILLGMRKNHARLEQAALDAMGPGFSGSAADAARALLTPSTSLPPIMQPLARLVAKAAGVYSGYANVGLYDTSISNVIETGIQEKNVTTMLQTSALLQAQLDKDLGSFKDKQRQYIQDQVNSLKAGGDVTLLQSQLEQTKQQLQDVSADVAGIRLASRSELQRQKDFTNELQALLDSRQSDPQMVISKAVDFPTQLTVSADQFNHPITWQGHVAPGDIVLVNVTGKWMPTCAINSYPYGNDPPLIPGGYTGSEGYAAFYESNQIKVHSNSFDQQHNDYVDHKTSDSAYGGAGWDYIGKLGGTIAVSLDYGSSDSQLTNNTDSTSTESRATINMNTGLRLPNTPEPNMPVGSLLLETSWVSSFNGAESPRRPHFLEPQTAFVAPTSVNPNEYQTIRLRFLVNDKVCSLGYMSDDGGQLGVSITVLQLQGNLVKQLGNAMGTALGHLRDSSSQYIKEGFLTPEEATSLRSQAIAQLNTACNCDSSKFEASLLGFYNKWVDSEIAEISRSIELIQRLRTVQQLSTQLDATQAELAAAKKEQALLALLPVQSMRALASRYLTTELNQLISYYDRNLYPAAKLRFPQTLSSLASGSDDLRLLKAAAWDDAFLDWADRVNRAAAAINTQFDISNPPKGVGMVRVIMRFPRNLSLPNPTDPTQQPYHVDPSGPAYLFPHVDPFIATAVWNEVMNGDGIAHLVVRPEDLYNLLGGSARLDCNQSAPAIHDMVLVGVLPKTIPSDANGNNAYTAGVWNVPLDVEPNVMYPTPAGPQSFVLDPGLTHYLPRVYFINEDKIDATLNQLQQAFADAASMEVAAGISPFGDFNFNLGAFRQQFQPPSTLKDPLKIIGEWMLVFDLETKNTAAPMSWLGPCGSGN